MKWRGILDFNAHLTRDARRYVWALLNVCDREMVRCAHNSNRTPNYKWLLEQSLPYGYVGLAQWAYARVTGMPDKVGTMLLAAAAHGGHLNSLEWVWSKWKSELVTITGENAWLCAIRAGHLGAVQFLHAHLSWVPNSVFDTAILWGRVDILRWLLDTSRCQWGLSMMLTAAGVGHVVIMEVLWAHQPQPQNMDRRTSWAAASKGHLDAFKWLLAHNCPWDEEKVRRRAPLHILQWLDGGRGPGAAR
jgi:hypothetical protein